MKKPIGLPQCLACAAALAAGGFIGWKGASPPETGEAMHPGPVRQPARERVPERGGKASREVALKMKTVRSAGTQEERIRASISLAMSLPASEFTAWAQGDRFDFRAGPELSIFRMILFERWITEDPDSLIAFSINNNHGQAYRAVAKLSREDPRRVIDFFRENPNDAFELGKLAEIGKHDPALALSRLAEMSARGMTPDDAQKSGDLFRAMASKSPAMLEAALAGLAPLLRAEAEKALIGERLGKSFAEEVRALWDRPDGWKIFNDAISRDNKLGAGLVEEIMNMPAAWRGSLADFPYYAVRSESAKQWLDLDLVSAGFTAAQAERIKRHALEHLASRNPQDAISRLDKAGLEAADRLEILELAFSRHRYSAERTESLIAMLSSEEEKTAVRKLVELQAFAEGKGQEKTSSAWLQQLSEGNPSPTTAWTFSQEAKRWDEGQVSEFEKSFNELPPAGKQKIAQTLASRVDDTEGNDRLIGNAVRYLVENPPADAGPQRYNSDPETTAARYAVRVASNDLSAASEWIDSLPQGDAKTWARRNVAMDMHQYDPAAVRDWIKSLPKAEQDDLNGYLEGKD